MTLRFNACDHEKISCKIRRAQACATEGTCETSERKASE